MPIDASTMMSPVVALAFAYEVLLALDRGVDTVLQALSGGLIVAVTETTSEDDIETLASALEEALR